MLLDNAKTKSRGSMGIPAEIAPDRILNKDAAPKEPAPIVDNGFSFDGSSSEKKEVLETEAAKDGTTDPEAMLKSLGVELTEDDFVRYVFKGSLEKTFALYGFKGKEFTVSLKTLTPKEVEAADWCWMKEVDDESHVSRDSGDRRRSVWLVSASLQGICGKQMPPSGPVTKDGKVDLKATIAAKRDILQEMGEATMGRIIQTYYKFSFAVGALLNDPEKGYLKKP
jgi:hypothetical protein